MEKIYFSYALTWGLSIDYYTIHFFLKVIKYKKKNLKNGNDQSFHMPWIEVSPLMTIIISAASGGN